ncbi:hypothetical protein JAAARDRAFT_716162 [Jaapia argillacea MUCL 33604]|uniref:DUF6589 domain-containing protein n=1 Tax=Jaapia argillacea MUCL 33604 TaxID=933084 RepID=A0A067P5U3_9AGAM|nr:hypothetical protein JAAARDRAFT_716162 [Jaapia argillacea MUCL 33604]
MSVNSLLPTQIAMLVIFIGRKADILSRSHPLWLRPSRGGFPNAEHSVLEPGENPGRSHPPPHLHNTEFRRSSLANDEVFSKVRKILALIEAEGLNLTIFLDAIFWGNPHCVDDPQVRYARTALLVSSQLSDILHRMWQPPLSSRSHHSRAKGARETIVQLVHEFEEDAMRHEMAIISKLFRTSADQLREEDLTNFAYEGVLKEVKEGAPNLWRVLSLAGYTAKQRTVNSHKNPEIILLVIVAMLSYTMSHHNNRLPKIFAVYFKSRGVAGRAFDCLHKLGLMMSHKWTTEATEEISKNCMNEVVRLMKDHIWIFSHDNVNILFRVYSQRVDNKSHFACGTAATVFIKRSGSILPPYDIFEMSYQSYPPLVKQMTYQVLRFLIESPEFDFGTYHDRDDPLLQPAPPMRALPCGEEHITLQYMLGTVEITEAAYEGNDRLIDEWFRQLGMSSMEEWKRTGLERIIPWIGDQLTVDRLQGLYRMRNDECNSFERLDWLVPVFGWLHLQMAFSNSLHQEALYHIAEAHIRVCWKLVGGVGDLAEFWSLDAKQITNLAVKLVREHASSEALDRMDEVLPDMRDKVQRQMIMFNRDVLHYIVLNQAIKHGDVGIMESMLPLLLLRFLGGKNYKYTIEILELLQGLCQEWPPAVRDFVRDHCWLVNNTGKRSGFLPVDTAQEMNIKDIKVTHRSEGPNIDWAYLTKIHPSVRIMRLVTAKVDGELGLLSRGKKHSVPQKQKDVKRLEDTYEASPGIHVYTPGRKIQLKCDCMPDVITEGCLVMQKGQRMKRWQDGCTFERSTGEDWESDIVGSSDSGIDSE